MRWPLVLRSTFDRAVTAAGEPYLFLLAMKEERIRRLELDLRDATARREQLERELDSTDPFTISRRAAENGNARAAELMDALQRAKLLRERGMEVPDDVLDIIRRGSKEWSR